MFGKLFGSKGRPPPARDVAALTAESAVPALQLLLANVPAQSHFGGMPALPAGVAWPVRAGKPLGFLARIELVELQRALPVDWLPATGALLFFYDMDEQPWGYDPADKGSWAVIHLAEDAAAAMGAAPAAELPRRNITFRRIGSLPSQERAPVAALALSDAESDAYFDLQDAAFDGLPQHQIGGFPCPVQGDDMELECQLASHGLYCGDGSGYRDARAGALKAGAADWRLLLQVDSDGELGVMWGDLGKLYFWVREEAARRGDFSGVWVVLQCT